MDRTILLGNSRVGYRVRRRLRNWPADPPRLDGATALVTGASGGLGLATATGLAKLGATVHLLGRHLDRLEHARAEITSEAPGAKLEVEQCDLSLLRNVRAFAADFTARVPELTILVHNAGLMTHERVETDEGNELSLATHVLGPFLMTDLLKDRLRRVVFVTSSGMYGQALHAEDPQYRAGSYRGVTAYARTKRMQVVLAQEWAKRLPDTLVHAVHPGWAETPGLTDGLPVFRTIMRPLLRTAAEGADTTVWLAANPDLPSGLLWHDRQPRPTHLLPHTRETPEQREQLWEYCVQRTV